MRRTDWLLLIGLSVPWGCSFLFFKVLGAELPPMVVALGRVALAAVAVNLVLVVLGIRLARYRAHWRGFLMIGLLNNAVPFTLFAWGTARVPSGTAAICNAMTPVFTVLVARAVSGGRLTWNKLAGVVLGFAGVVVLVGPEAAAGGDVLGSVLCLGGALSYALGAPFMAALRGLPPLAVAGAQLFSSTAILLPPVLLIDRPWTLPAPSAEAWAALLALALFSTAFAYLLFFRLVASAGAANAMLVTFLIPVTALLLGNLVLDEPITRGALLGTAVIAAGLALLDGRWLPARRREPV